MQGTQLNIAPVFTLTTDIIVGAAPPEKAGAASAISETGSEFGGALGIAVLGSIGTAIYRNNIARGFPPGVATEVAASSKENLATALKEGSQMPLELNISFVDSANRAFISGMHAAAVICMIVMLFLALLSLKWLKPGRTKN